MKKYENLNQREMRRTQMQKDEQDDAIQGFFIGFLCFIFVVLLFIQFF